MIMGEMRLEFSGGDAIVIPPSEVVSFVRGLMSGVMVPGWARATPTHSITRSVTTLRRMILGVFIFIV